MQLGADQFAVERRDSHVRVSLIGEFDDFNVDEFEASLKSTLDAAAAAVEFDTTRVTYVRSPALRALIAFHDAAAARRVPVSISGASYVVRRLMEVTGLSTTFGLSPGGGEP